MAKSKRSNYLIDKSFQLGFISRYVFIILLTIIGVFFITGVYYWFFSSFGEFKLETIVTYIQQGHTVYEGKKVYIYGKEEIQVIEDKDEKGNKIYRCHFKYANSTSPYKTGDIVGNISEVNLAPKIGSVQRTTTRFRIIFFPLLLTGIILIIIISIYSLFFSHRMAGPIYRLRVSLDRMLSGDFNFKILIREKDFFTNIVQKLEKLRQNIKEKK